jgi:hypothetical protein
MRMVGCVRVLLLISFCLLALGDIASADDGDPRFRRTTPRGALSTEDGALLIGVPGGRAWGIESELLPVPASPTTIVARLRVSDASVREAFVRVAYYASASARTRQIATVDSAPASMGERAVVALALEPPPGAVAYRVRVLARLSDPASISANDAITATLRLARAGARPLGALYSTLLP